MLAVLSPAKDLDYASPLPKVVASQPRMLTQAADLMGYLKPLSPPDVARLMKLSDGLAALNVARFGAWQPDMTPPQARPAVLAFNGDVYQGLQAGLFSAADFAFAQQRLRILSGLYGLLRPLDLIRPYRLEMGTALATAKGPHLYAFWGEHITALLKADAEACGAQVVVNLASVEYFKAVKPKVLGLPVVEPVFMDYHAASGQYKVVSFYAKKARGQMASFLVKHALHKAEDLKGFTGGGYGFNQGLSGEWRWVFTRRAGV